MADKGKAILIQAIILVISFIVTLVLHKYFETKGFIKLSYFSSFFLLAPLGLYVIFGKYVYIRGVFLAMQQRIVLGLFFILVMPVIYFIVWCIRK